MSSEAVDNAAPTSDQITRLERRLERERTARLEAEAVAEKGLRDLYDINQDLDRRVQERVAESQRLAVRAGLAERVKDEILAAVSHELRTPLMAVVGALDLMEADAGDYDACLKAAIDGATRLRELVDELFAVINVGGGSAEAVRRTVPIATFCDSFADSWRLPALKAGVLLVISVETDEDDIHIDVERTRAALDRVIQNAISHAGTGTVSLVVTMADGNVSFSVADEGPGIAADQLEAMLEPFETGDRSSTRTKGGMGLGLSVVRGLVELQDGTVTIDSEIAVGTEVRITVPA